MIIDPRKLKRKITFQTRSETSDGSGSGGTVTWTDTISLWAQKWDVKASERIESARTKQNAIHRWHIRYDTAVTPSMRIKWVDRFSITHYQEIVAINVLNDTEVMEILAEEKA